MTTTEILLTAALALYIFNMCMTWIVHYPRQRRLTKAATENHEGANSDNRVVFEAALAEIRSRRVDDETP